MRTSMLIAALAVWLAIGGPDARADGGTVQLSRVERGCRLSVFTAPNPLRAGPIDVSVLVQEADSGAPLAQATVEIALMRRARPGQVLHAVATEGGATNKLFRAASVELPAAGWWDVEIVCQTADGPIRGRFAMEAAAPLPRWPAVWPWVSWPFAVIALFGVHRWLVGRKAGPAVCGNGSDA
jgi:hypothetical protein